MKRLFITTLIVVLCPLTAYAYVFGGTNLGFGGYPSHTCMKPNKPFKPYSFDSQWEIDSYNAEVDAFNSDLQLYSDCIDEYLENANNDIKRIKLKAKEAVDEAT
jgi:hypothetical protein